MKLDVPCPEDMKKLVVIPVHKGDDENLRLLLETATAFGYDLDQFVVLSTDGQSSDAAGVFMVANPVMDWPQKWPDTVNLAAHFLLRMAFRENAWALFLEPDCTFLQGNALDVLAEQAYDSKRPVVATPMWNIDLGWCSNGVAFYGPDFFQEFGDQIARVNEEHPHRAWDSIISPKLYPDFVAPTHVFQQDLRVTEVPLERANPAAYIHHGCKDGSLARAVLANMDRIKRRIVAMK